MILLSILCGCLAVDVVVLAVKLRTASLETDRWKRRHDERDADYNKQLEENASLLKQLKDESQLAVDYLKERNAALEQVEILTSDDPDGIIADRLEKIRKMQEETEMNAKFTSFMALMQCMMNSNAQMSQMYKWRF